MLNVWWVRRALLRRALPAGWATVAVLGLLGGWCWLARDSFGYLTAVFTQPDFRTNQVVLLAVLALVGWQIWQQRANWREFWQPHGSALLGVLFGLCCVLYLLVSQLGIRTLSATVFGLGCYVWSGFWLPPARWRANWLLALLAVFALPFGDHLQTFAGYPLRIVTAHQVQHALQLLGVPIQNLETILVVENRAAQVDVPCSGVKGLWTGLLLLLAVSWLEQARLTWRWLLLAVGFALLLLLANFWRVLLLVVAGQVLQQPLLAAVLHVPLGVLGFVLAGAALLFGLRRWADNTLDTPAAVLPGYAVGDGRWLLAALGCLLLAMAFYRPPTAAGLAQPVARWQLPAGLQATELPLNQNELFWFTRDGADQAQRWQWQYQGYRGSLLMVGSRTWRAHHKPERCFEVQGYQVGTSETWLLQPDFAVQRVAVNGAGQPQAVAIYWFQNGQQTTADYATRLWDDVRWQPNRWVLVALAVPPDMPAPLLQTLAQHLKTTLHQQLSETE